MTNFKKSVNWYDENLATLLPQYRGKYVGVCTITEERKQAVDFTDCYYDGGFAMLARRSAGAVGGDSGLGAFGRSLKASFIRTFVTEDRWKTLADGFGITLLIALLATLFETALALGYTPRRAFFRFVLPQAVRTILPVYRGELIGLLKTTSIVGYIDIGDLTKASDLVRSRTYESFFPIITTAFIYFVASWALASALERIGRRLDPASGRKGGRRGSFENVTQHPEA